MSEKIKKLPLIAFLALILAATVAALFLFIIPIWKGAATMGTDMGAAEGRTVGLFVGSFNGITSAIHEAEEDAAENPDVTTSISNHIKELGKLDVLAAGVKLKNMHQDGGKYKALYVLKGEAIFSVDMSKIEIFKSGEGKISILLPDPEVEVYIDNTKTEKLAEESRWWLNGSTKDGFTKYINSMQNTVEEVEDTLGNYDVLLEEAKASAIKTVRQIAADLLGDDQKVKVGMQNGN